ncbi:MAG: hypothetical protein M3285_05845 [Actinomycetota bacterium]|nr:hypothetical protein [Actinomycetota bacterium]
MKSTVFRALSLLLALGLLAWWLRLLAHAKVPPPEGRWSELRLEADSGR